MQGEEILIKEQQRLDKIRNGNLADVLQDLIVERMGTTTSRLEKLRGQYAVELENESAEVNTKIFEMIMNANRYIGKEPVAISDKIKALVEEFRANKDTIDQERKNDLYFELGDHIAFFKTKVKP